MYWLSNMIYCKTHIVTLFLFSPFIFFTVCRFLCPVWLLLSPVAFHLSFSFIHSSHAAVLLSIFVIRSLLSIACALPRRLPDSMDMIQFSLHFLYHLIKQIYDQKLISFLKLTVSDRSFFYFIEKCSEMHSLFVGNFVAAIKSKIGDIFKTICCRHSKHNSKRLAP